MHDQIAWRKFGQGMGKDPLIVSNLSLLSTYNRYQLKS